MLRGMLRLLPISTPRLVLRRFQPLDLDRFAAGRADEELARYQGWAPIDREAARAFVSEMAERDEFGSGEWVQIAVACRETDRLLGDMGLCVTREEAEIGFTFLRDAQGQGLAAEAVRALCEKLFALGEVARVKAITDERNLASIRVLERVGMTLAARYEGTFKQESCVELRYELLRRGASGCRGAATAG
jgi:RimJ/RimL family protein N-acetyltransferase